MNEEEKKYLENYDITQFERPSIATDVAVFSIMGKIDSSGREKVRDAGNYRKIPEKKLKILLIKRGNFPYKDAWALPGGFCRREEDVYETARRELYEETHVKDAYLNLSGIYGDVGRDPRGWIISHTFLALMDGSQCSLRAGSDAWEARWFDVEFEKCEKKKRLEKDCAEIENEYFLRLVHSDFRASNREGRQDGEPIVLSARILQYRHFENYHESTSYEVLENHGFAFDHAKLITCALLNLQRQVEEDGKIVFDLMPEVFTLTELQNAFEIILDKKLLVANFRRKMADYVLETGQMVEGAGHRPAKLFRRNIEAFYR